jgi:nitroreductase
VLGRVDPEHGIHPADLYGSVVQAAWSFMLALRSRGLGSAWTTIHLAREQQVASLLGIPDDVTQVALLPVAHTIGHEFSPAQRLPVDEVTYWEAWGSS